MERRGTAIGLLMLSLAALLLVGAAVAADDTLRLRSDDPLRGTTDWPTEWPWKCCDDAFCLKTFPPRCTCRDVVDKCVAACTDCEEVGWSGYVCHDFFWGPETGELPKPCVAA